MSDKKTLRVRDVMLTDTYCIADGMLTVAEAIEMAKQNNAATIFIAKRSDDDEWGMVKLSDIAREVLAKDRAPERVNLYEIMTKPVLSVKSGMLVKYSARLFDSFDINTAPVIDDNEILGVLSYTEMVLKSH
ncbi:CBS domain-containing protein [Catenovulum sp. SM1970]|uniref:CBS domain-containing protein n=1 Tax=Marinifaba aquimaris TaxID=2741323 RepID=UPI001571AF3D|nr:CBS domain-containing protein [Marinifaba aquimaris]NTS76039.1 CBS domain-containing protein [Marinifaba aquimaris]